METMRSPSPGRRAPTCRRRRRNRSLPSHPHASSSDGIVSSMPSLQALSGVLATYIVGNIFLTSMCPPACTIPPFDLADREHTRRLFHDLYRGFPARPLKRTQGRRNSTAYSILISTRTGPVPFAFGTRPISIFHPTHVGRAKRNPARRGQSRFHPTHAGRARHRTTKLCSSSLQRARRIFRRS